jgi:dynein heavy chain
MRLQIIERVRKEYTSLADFTPANAAKASSAAEGLCKYVAVHTHCYNSMVVNAEVSGTTLAGTKACPAIDAQKGKKERGV